MIGIIVTAHGGFADEITKSLTLIIGAPEKYEAVNFTTDISGDQLEKLLLKAAEHLSGCDGILILTDLMGGTPANASVRLKMKLEKPVEVIGGLNLPLLIEASTEHCEKTDVAQFAKEMASFGKENIVLYEQEDLSSGELDE